MKTFTTESTEGHGGRQRKERGDEVTIDLFMMWVFMTKASEQPPMVVTRYMDHGLKRGAGARAIEVTEEEATEAQAWLAAQRERFEEFRHSTQRR